MIFWRVKELLEGGGELLRAEAELASKRFRRVLVGSALVLLGVTVALAGLLTVAAGITVEIAQHLGWSAALMIMGASVTALCVLVWLIAYLAGGSHDALEEPLFPETDTARHEAQEAKEKMTDAATPGSGSSGPSSAKTGFEIPASVEEFKDNAVGFATKNPLLVGSGALLVLSLLGPGKTLRMVSRGAAVAGMVGTLIEIMGSDHESQKRPASRDASANATAPKPESAARSTPAATTHAPPPATKKSVPVAPRGKGVSARAAAL